MAQTDRTPDQTDRTDGRPDRKALLKPFQLLTLAAVFGVFVLLVVLLTLRRIDIGLIAGGAVFIVTLVVLAMLVLSYQPNAEATRYLDRFEPRPAHANATDESDAAATGDERTATDADDRAGSEDASGGAGGDAVRDTGAAAGDDAAGDDADGADAVGDPSVDVKSTDGRADDRVPPTTEGAADDSTRATPRLEDTGDEPGPGRAAS